MVELINGKGDEDGFEDWAILFADRPWVGRTGYSAAGITLAPIYELRVVVSQTRGPNGQAGLDRSINVMPPSWLTSLRELTFPADTPCVKLSTLSRAERRRIIQAIRGCDEILRVMRAADAGITLEQKTPGKLVT